jgi:H+/Cl- antiporter ClcA
MLRRFLEEFGLFLIPFAVFLVYLLAAGRNPLRAGHWNPHLTRLALAGLLIVIGTLVYDGVFSERREGGYIPAHMENGHLVPGRFQ